MYVGIDVSKDHLDVASEDGTFGARYPNDDDGHADLTRKLLELGPELVVLESTGPYQIEASLVLMAAKLPLAVVNPRQVRDFAKALGILAKTDKLDAGVIARFGATVKPAAQPLPDAETLELEAVLTRRRQLVSMIAAEKNRMQSLFGPAKNSPAAQSIRDHLSYLTKLLNKLERDLQKRLKNSKGWKENEDLLKSAPGVGKVTAWSMAIDLPELGTLNRKQIAALAGVAPLNRDSGQSKGKRRIWGGRASVRTSLYMACFASLKRPDNFIRARYDELRAAKKPHLVAMVACMRKLLTILNAIIRDGKPWDPALANG